MTNIEGDRAGADVAVEAPLLAWEVPEVVCLSLAQVANNDLGGGTDGTFFS
ncbi:hypothetical protein [Zavarzinia sp. CC-PAN008]|uniref:hypothetical protein n=1 Tax=Zavarzinia sp. CC-PAN008 TaxID=3243332 RepID=UPI003F745FFA